MLTLFERLHTPSFSLAFCCSLEASRRFQCNTTRRLSWSKSMDSIKARCGSSSPTFSKGGHSLLLLVGHLWLLSSGLSDGLGTASFPGSCPFCAYSPFWGTVHYPSLGLDAEINLMTMFEYQGGLPVINGDPLSAGYPASLQQTFPTPGRFSSANTYRDACCEIKVSTHRLVRD